MPDPLDSLRDEMSAFGLGSPQIVIDDRIHRYRGPDDHSDNCWYVLHQCGDLVLGGFGSWRLNLTKRWCSRDQSKLSREEVFKLRQSWNELQGKIRAEELQLQSNARTRAADLIRKSPPATAHPYLAKKGIKPLGDLRISKEETTNGWLALSLQDERGVIHSAQFIAEDGTKRFLFGGRTAGCYHVVHENPSGPIILCEGYATGASIAQATGWTTIAAMNCGNLLPVAKSIRQANKDRTILIAGDDDAFTDGNPGRTKAELAAKEIRAKAVFPVFADEALLNKPTDFNDLHRLAGLESVRKAIAEAAMSDADRLLSAREYDARRTPPPLRPLYTLSGRPVFTPGNISTITALIKTGKSAVIGAIAGSGLQTTQNGSDFLGFCGPNPSKKAVLWFDSEQSPDDFWHGVTRAIHRAHEQSPPPWLHAYCLTGLDQKTALQCVESAIDHCATLHGGIHVILLDGTADLVNDVNDAAESNAFVAHLHGLAIKHDTHIVNVIHFNPGSEKSRGHLGSQLERKSESNLTIEKDSSEISVLYSTKNRRAAIPKQTGPRFKWSDENQMHVSIESLSEARIDEESEELHGLAESAFGDRPSMRRNEIESRVATLTGKGASTSYRKVSRMIELEVVKLFGIGLYTLTKTNPKQVGNNFP